MKPRRADSLLGQKAEARVSNSIAAGWQSVKRQAVHGGRKNLLENWDAFNTVSFPSEEARDWKHVSSRNLESDASVLASRAITWLMPALIAFLTASSGVLIEKVSGRLNGLLFGFCPGDWFAEPAECQASGRWVSWAPSELKDPTEHLQAWALYAAIAAAFAGISATLVCCFAPTARGSGIPEVKTILGGFVMKEVLEFKTLVVKVVGLAFSVSSGMALGKEGPLVHVACCWANFCSKLSPRYMENEGKRRELISTAAAAGVAVAFGAPVGGVLFSYEEVSTMFPNRTMIRSFFGAVVAALTLLWYNPTGAGKLTMFESYTPDMPQIYEFPWFVLLGVVGGMLGALFVRWNIMISAGRAEGTAFRRRVPIVVEVVGIALITAVTSFPSLYTRHLSSVTINALFHTCEDSHEPRPFSNDMMGLCEGDDPSIGSGLVVALLLAAAVRFLQMTITFGTGVPCGLFVPSLYTGACLGRCLGIFVRWLYSYMGLTMTAVHPGIYAMVGAAAVLGGVCRVTISLVVIMYELTSALQLIVPFMIAVLTSKWVGDYFGEGIYDRCIVLRKYPYLHEPDEFTSEQQAAAIMDQEIECLYTNAGSLGSLLEKATTTSYGGFPLVASEEDKTLLGYVHTAELLKHCQTMLQSQFVKESMPVGFMRYAQTDQAPSEPGLDFSSLVDETVLRIPESMPVAQVHNLFRQLGIKLILVNRCASLAGLITKKSFLHHLHVLEEGHDVHDGDDRFTAVDSFEEATGHVQSRRAATLANPAAFFKDGRDSLGTRLASMRFWMGATPQAAVEVETGSPHARDKNSLRKWGDFTTTSVPTDGMRDFREHVSTVHLQGSRFERLTHAAVPWLIPALVGFLTATSGSLVEVASDWLNNLRFGHCTTNFFLTPESCGLGWTSWAALGVDGYTAYILVSVVFATASALLVWAFAPTARGSGIPEVKTILGGFVMKDVLEMKTLVVKLVGLTLSVSSGMSLGKEGPLVHVACCWANWCSKLSKRYVGNETKRRELISTAAAAGVSVAFGTPLGGVLFSYEEVSTIFSNQTMVRAFFAAVVAALSLRWYDPTGTGKLTMFEASFVDMPALSEYPFFLLLGVAGGVLGAIFVKVNIAVSRGRMDGTAFRKRVPIVAEVALLALVTAITSWPFLFTRGMSTATIRMLFQTCGHAADKEHIDMSMLCDEATGESLMAAELLIPLGVAALLRFVQMSFTFGTGVPCGLFVPSLYTGACVGRALGAFVAALNSQYHFSDGAINPGVYAMVGAASVLGGVCRVTISLVVIMFGLTNALQLIVPFMLALITAKFVGDLFSDGIYDACIVLRGYPYLHEPDEECFTLKAKDLMDSRLQCLSAERTTLGGLKEILEKTPYGGLPLVRSQDDHTLLGYVPTAPLLKHVDTTLLSALMDEHQPVAFKQYSAQRKDDALDFSKFVDQTVLRVVPETPLAQVHSIFWRLGVKLVLVARFGKIAGLITKKSFVDHMLERHHAGGHGATHATDLSGKDRARRPIGAGGVSEPLLGP